MHSMPLTRAVAAAVVVGCALAAGVTTTATAAVSKTAAVPYTLGPQVLVSGPSRSPAALWAARARAA